MPEHYVFKIVNVCGIQLLHFDIFFLLHFPSIPYPFSKKLMTNYCPYMIVFRIVHTAAFAFLELAHIFV